MKQEQDVQTISAADFTVDLPIPMQFYETWKVNSVTHPEIAPALEFREQLRRNIQNKLNQRDANGLPKYGQGFDEDEGDITIGNINFVYDNKEIMEKMIERGEALKELRFNTVVKS